MIVPSFAPAMSTSPENLLKPSCKSRLLNPENSTPLQPPEPPDPPDPPDLLSPSTISWSSIYSLFTPPPTSPSSSPKVWVFPTSSPAFSLAGLPFWSNLSVVDPSSTFSPSSSSSSLGSLDLLLQLLHYQNSSCRSQERSLSPSSFLKKLSPPRYQNSSCRGQERSFSSPSFLKESPLPRYQTSSCRGQERSFSSPSFLKEIPLPRYQNSSCRGQERSFSSPSFLKEIPLPRYQTSFCRGRERSLPSSSFLKERTFPPSSLPFSWPSRCCSFIVQPAVDLEGCFSETSFSVVYKGSAAWCFVTSVLTADSRIVLLALVAASIMNKKSLSVFFVLQGIFSLTSFSIVMVQGLHDDVYCLSVRFPLIYPTIYYCIVLRFASLAANWLASKALAPSFVTVPSFEDV